MRARSVLTWNTALVEFTVSVPAHQHMNDRCRPLHAISMGAKRCFLNASAKAADSSSSSQFRSAKVSAGVEPRLPGVYTSPSLNIDWILVD